MANVLCSKCGESVNSRGLAGHLRWKHKVKSGRALREEMEKTKPDNSPKPGDYNKVVSWMDRLRDVEERANELKWMYYNKRLGISLEELRSLLSTMRTEYVRILTEERVEMSGAVTGNKKMLVVDVLKAHPERRELTQFDYDPKKHEEAVKENSKPITPEENEEAKRDLIKSLFGRKSAKLLFQQYEEKMRKKHG